MSDDLLGLRRLGKRQKKQAARFFCAYVILVVVFLSLPDFNCAPFRRLEIIVFPLIPLFGLVLSRFYLSSWLSKKVLLVLIHPSSDCVNVLSNHNGSFYFIYFLSLHDGRVRRIGGCFIPLTDTQTPGNLATAGAPLSTVTTGVSSPASSLNGSKRRGDFGGSHGSLDALASGAERESFFALLRDLGAQSSSGSSCNGNGVPSRSSPERDLDDPVHAKPVGCAPSRLAELLKPNFHSARMVVSNTQSEPGGATSSTTTTGTFTLLAQQQQSAMLR